MSGKANFRKSRDMTVSSSVSESSSDASSCSQLSDASTEAYDESSDYDNDDDAVKEDDFIVDDSEVEEDETDEGDTTTEDEGSNELIKRKRTTRSKNSMHFQNDSEGTVSDTDDDVSTKRIRKNMRIDSDTHDSSETSSSECYNRKNTATLAARKLTYKCDRCIFKTSSKTYYDAHCLTHLLIKPFACLFCNYESAYKSNFVKHKFTHREYKKSLTRFVPSIHSVIADSKPNIVLTRAELRPKADLISSALYDNEIKDGAKTDHSFAYLNNSASVNTDRSSDPSASDHYISSCKLKCSLCSFETLSSDNLQLHVKTHSENTATYECTECSYKGSSSVGLYMHNRKMHSYESTHLTGEKNHVLLMCKKCAFKATTNFSLKMHCKRKHSDNTEPANSPESTEPADSPESINYFPCTLCTFKSYTSFGLRMHYIKKHSYKKEQLDNLESIKSIQCTLCPFKFSNSAMLKEHYKDKHSYKKKQLETLENVKYFCCSVCPFKSFAFFGLKLHYIRKHSFTRDYFNSIMNDRAKLDNSFALKDGTYICSLCSFKTTSKQGLLIHFGIVHRKKL